MKKVLIKIIEVIGFILSLFADFMLSFIDLTQKKQGHESQFGSEFDIANRFNKGFVISKHRRLTRRKSFESILLASHTGAGKTTRLILRNLYELKNCSIVVNDPSKELFQLTSGYLSKFFNIQVLNFSDSKCSAGYNILSRIKKPSDVNKIAHLLISATLDKGNSDPFWQLQSQSLLQILIRLTLHQPKEYINMANVLYLLKQFSVSDKIDALIAKTGDEALILDYKNLLSIPEKTLQNIVASTKAGLQIFDDFEIATVTAYDTISFDSIRQKPTIIYLHNSISEMKYINILNGIFFEQLFGFFLQKLPEKKELDCFIILEECSSIFIPLLPLATANLRKHCVGSLICIQNVGQLKTTYKAEADNIYENCVTKIFLPGQTSLDTLKEIETLSGKCTYTDKKGAERVKPLITIDEIRLLPENRSLILSANNPIIKGRTSPYFRSRKYRAFSKIPPISLTGNIPEGPIPLLPL